MNENKWNAFVLELSFLDWHILGEATFGIAEIFYAAQYHNLANVEIFHELKKLDTSYLRKCGCLQ